MTRNYVGYLGLHLLIVKKQTEKLVRSQRYTKKLLIKIPTLFQVK